MILGMLLGGVVTFITLLLWFMGRQLVIKQKAAEAIARLYAELAVDNSALKSYIEKKHFEQTGEVASPLVVKKDNNDLN